MNNNTYFIKTRQVFQALIAHKTKRVCARRFVMLKQLRLVLESYFARMTDKLTKRRGVSDSRMLTE